MKSANGSEAQVATRELYISAVTSALTKSLLSWKCPLGKATGVIRTDEFKVTLNR
jgi:hypothetical protein